MNNNLYIPAMYPMTLSKTVTLNVKNIMMHDDTKGYSFEVKCDDDLVIKFDQSMSTSPVFGPKAILNASIGLARYRRILYPGMYVTGCLVLLPPGDQMLECFIIDAYRELMYAMGQTTRHVNIVVKWPEKKETLDD